MIPRPKTVLKFGNLYQETALALCWPENLSFGKGIYCIFVSLCDLTTDELFDEGNGFYSTRSDDKKIWILNTGTVVTLAWIKPSNIKQIGKL